MYSLVSSAEEQQYPRHCLAGGVSGLYVVNAIGSDIAHGLEQDSFETPFGGVLAGFSPLFFYKLITVAT